MIISLFDYEEEENQSKTFASPLPHQQPQGMMTLYTPTFLVSHHMMYASPPPPPIMNLVVTNIRTHLTMVSIKEIRNKHTGLSEGYGFVEFLSHDVADNVLKKFNGTYMPNTDMPFPLNWANAFDSLFYNTFSEIYLSVKAATAVIDAYTDRSKGFGFVRFGDVNERTKAMTEMHGLKCSNRAMRTGPFFCKDRDIWKHPYFLF
ncbi:hypothetical protein HID58_037740 [Brassica napus]|uniref:RRM domain-containing protein n=1 Tax=Brassica napus TaxID=3708 RepID=A0ABQ8BMK6_BRANA|nr:hypothetical protein HID58_037740 [Brassica napus]